MPRPDWAVTTTVAVGEDVVADSATWARAIFDVGSVSLPVKVLFGLRQALVGVLGIPRGDRSMFEVRNVIDGEAVIDVDDRHLRFVATVGHESGLVHVTTAVTFKGWRGRLYFLPVRFLHDPVTRSMMTGAARRLRAVPS
ncbi:MAG: DUF2867 domain-containing protein [Actinomycetota bacterium]